MLRVSINTYKRGNLVAGADHYRQKTRLKRWRMMSCVIIIVADYSGLRIE